MQLKNTLLRDKLKELGCSAIIIPTNDPHFGEYTQNYYKTRVWYSGFTGTAGTLVVTLDDAALWTDSRYFVQGEKQLSGSGIKLMKLKMPQTPTIAQWVISQYPKGAKVAIDKALFSYSEYTAMVAEFAPCEIEIVEDFFTEIWKEREELVFNPIDSMPVEVSGESTESKYKRVKDLLQVGEIPFAYVVSACDEVAWLCNIRGNDIPFNPLVQSYAVITHERIHLFVNTPSLSIEIRNILENNGVKIHDYIQFEEFLSNVPAQYLRIYSPSKITVRDYNALNIAGAKFKVDSILGGAINHLKSLKNSVEVNGFKRAFELDGVAWCKVLKYISDSLAKGVELDEYIIAEKFSLYRKEAPEYKGESFSPIIAFGAAAALPHYSATKESAQKIGTNNFLLMDTGGQYICGTTDTTRTIPLGTLTQEQKRHYTLVLKGMIALTMSKFPAGTRGSQLDVIARGPLFNDGLMYFHGTCHGIGHYLCVHEGPQSIRMEENPVTLKSGMVVSNEPAIYFEGAYGIRTENVMAIEPWKTTQFNDFYQFNTLTLVPIAISCILKELLTPQELEWITNYNKHVCNVLTPLLDGEAAKWLINNIM